MSITVIAPLVKEILTNNVDSRNDDNVLILAVWREQDKSLTKFLFPFTSFASKLVNKKLADFNYVARVRRKLQEEFPHLRGDNWKIRQRHCAVIKEELRDPQLLAGGTP